MPRNETNSSSGKRSGRRVVGSKRKGRKNVPHGVASIAATFNNTIVAITDASGNILSWSSAERVGFKGSRKGTPFAAQVAAQNAAAIAQDQGVRAVDVKISGKGAGREQALRGLRESGLEVRTVQDVKQAPVHASPRPLSITIQSTRPAVLDAINDFATTLELELDSDETIIQSLASRPRATDSAHVEQLRANAELRARFVRDVRTLPAADVLKLSKSAGRPASSGPDQWKAERRVFSVRVKGVDHYPLFQFTADGQPLPAIRDILQAFAGLTDWQIALWFLAPNAWLGNQAPMNVLQHDPEAVLRAARHAVEPLEV